MLKLKFRFFDVYRSFLLYWCKLYLDKMFQWHLNNIFGKTYWCIHWAVARTNEYVKGISQNVFCDIAKMPLKDIYNKYYFKNETLIEAGNISNGKFHLSFLS